MDGEVSRWSKLHHSDRQWRVWRQCWSPEYVKFGELVGDCSLSMRRTSHSAAFVRLPGEQNDRQVSQAADMSCRVNAPMWPRSTIVSLWMLIMAVFMERNGMADKPTGMLFMISLAGLLLCVVFHILVPWCFCFSVENWFMTENCRCCYCVFCNERCSK